MVSKNYHRSLTFPTPNSPKNKIRGRGSHSLPSRLHPLLSPIHDHIHSLLTWQQQRQQHSRSWLILGLAHLDRLLAALDDLLQHPRSQDHLRRRGAAAWTTGMLDDFLQLTDAYGSLRSAVADLKGHVAASRTAVWRDDVGRMSRCAMEQRRAEKEVARIAATVRIGVGRWGQRGGEMEDEEREMVDAVREVVVAVAEGTAAVFGGVAAVAAGKGREKSRCLMRFGTMRKADVEEEEEEEEERLEKVEEWMGEVEKGSERLFRSLVNSRVFLLNAFTPRI